MESAKVEAPWFAEGHEMRPQAVLHSCVAIGVPSVYCSLLLRASFSGVELVFLTLGSVVGVIGAIWQMLVITRSKNASEAILSYVRLYRSAHLGMRHAAGTSMIVAATVVISFAMSLEMERWAFGAIEGLRLATIVLVGLTTWRLASNLWWMPIVTLMVTDFWLFTSLPMARPIDQWSTYFGGMLGIYVLMETQHFIDRLLGLTRVQAR